MLLCPKCKQPLVTTGKDFVICCDEVIFMVDEAYNNTNEAKVGIS